MRLFREFREFAVRGNVIDLAVGVILGAAFGKIVSSFVADVLTPPLGVLIGGVNFTDLAFTLREGTTQSPAVVIAYGKFIQTLIDFTIVALVIFVCLRLINSLQRKREEAPAADEPSRQEVLLTEIRDLLKK